MGMITVLLQCALEPASPDSFLTACNVTYQLGRSSSVYEEPDDTYGWQYHQDKPEDTSVFQWICLSQNVREQIMNFWILLSSLQKRFYFRDFPNTSINTNTQDISVHYISTSTSSKYHRSPPQSIFKSWHFPCADISAELSSQAEQQDKWWLSLIACVVNHHCSFRCQVWFSTCWLSWFLRPVSHIHSLSVIICLDVHWCRVPAQVQNNTVCLTGTSRWATACVRSVCLQLYPRTGC